MLTMGYYKINEAVVTIIAYSPAKATVASIMRTARCRKSFVMVMVYQGRSRSSVVVSQRRLQQSDVMLSWAYIAFLRVYVYF